MKILINLVSDKKVIISKSYNRIIHGIIYKFLDTSDAVWFYNKYFGILLPPLSDKYFDCCKN